MYAVYFVKNVYYANVNARMRSHSLPPHVNVLFDIIGYIVLQRIGKFQFSEGVR